jgi:outer membrane protein assembly factor BamB
MADPGELKWQAPITGLGFACPSVASDGTIMYATHTNGGVLYAIDPVDGTILRQTQLPGAVEHAVALGDNDEVFFNTIRSAIASGDPPQAVAGCWDFDTFTEIWQSPLDGGADTSPILGNDRVYLGIVVNPQNPNNITNCVDHDICGRYYSFDMNTGDRIIDMWVEGWAACPGVIDEEGRVFFGVEDITGGEVEGDNIWPGRFYAIDGVDPASGTEPTQPWPAFDAEGDFGAPVGYANGVVYSACRDEHLYGFDAATGALVFDRHINAPSWTGTTIGRNPDNGRLVLYCGTQRNSGDPDSGQLFAVELDGTIDGELAWSNTVPGGMSFGNPALDDLGNVYAVNGIGHLMAFDRFGSQLWTYALPGWDDPDGGSAGGVGGPTILDDGTVLVGSNGGYLLAFEGNGNHLADDVPWPKYKHDIRSTANPQTPIRHTISGDIDGDGRVDTNDLLALLAAWGTDEPSADLNGDGVVGVDDLMTLLNNWS